MARHFIDLWPLPSSDLRSILDAAKARKAARNGAPRGAVDKDAPLAGRTLRSGARQGDVFGSLAILAPGGCTAGWAQTVRTERTAGELACRVATGCDSPARLELCLHAGGHEADPAWVERAWRLTMPLGSPVAAGRSDVTSP